MGRGRPKKEKKDFENISDEFKALVNSLESTDIRVKISEVALNQLALNEAKKNDEDLKQKQEAAKDAMAMYVEGKKANSEKMLFCKMVLKGRGQRVGDADEAPVTLKKSA